MKKLVNTKALIDFITGICDTHDLKPATRMGAGISVYLNALIQQAEVESIELAHRNLDRQIAMLQAVRQGGSAEEMATIADEHARQTVVRELALQQPATPQ